MEQKYKILKRINNIEMKKEIKWKGDKCTVWKEEVKWIKKKITKDEEKTF